MSNQELIEKTVATETVVTTASDGESDSDPETSSDVALCPNCATPINGPFCATCGQSQKNLNKQVWTLAGEVLDDVFRLDSRVARTLFALFFRPGFLTTEYFDGRRARYTPPVRLYLVISFLFFFITPVMNNLDTVPSDEVEVITLHEDGEDGADWKDIKQELPNINLDWLSNEENEALAERLEIQLKKTVDRVKEDPAGLWGGVMDLMSAVMFFMLPFFAIFLKLFYIGSGVYYAQHLLLALHNHCFLFLATLLTGALELLDTTTVGVVSGPIASLTALWIPVYMYLSLKNTYGQSHTMTAFKFLFIASIYIVIASLGLAAAFIFEVLTQ